MALKIWVGKRESDILTYNFYDISITFWGSNQDKNHSFCTTKRIKDNYKSSFINYILELLSMYISQNNNVEIHFYNNSLAYKIINSNPSLKEYIININAYRVFNILRHKTLSRVWLQNTIDVPQFTYLSRDECQYANLASIFPQYNKYVIQKSISGGGNGTYLTTQYNWEDILLTLDKDDIFLVSPYYENNISLSCHLIIDNANVIVLPISEQILNYDNNKISYCGNRYLPYSSGLSQEIKKVARHIGYRLMALDYRGICGLDFIYAENKIMLIEINPRYQGSSYLINAELQRLNLPSLFELNTVAFNNYINESIIKDISNISFTYESHTCFYRKNDLNVKSNIPQNANLFLDGSDNACYFEEGVYLYRYLSDNTTNNNG